MKLIESRPFDDEKSKQINGKKIELVAGWDIQKLIKDARHGRHTLHTREGFYNDDKKEEVNTLFSRPKTQLNHRTRVLTASSKSTKKSSTNSALLFAPNVLHSSDLLYFHSVHGRNVQLSQDRHVASRRKDTFCNGILFGYRPITVGEVVHIKFNKVWQYWRGGIKLGFTTFNPSFTDSDQLPSYAIPDPSKNFRYWAVPLADRYVSVNNVFSFIVSDDGRVNYFINNENKGTFLKGLRVTRPLWPMFDLYGKIEEISVISEKSALQRHSSQPEINYETEDNLTSEVGPLEEGGNLQLLRFHKRVGLNIKLDENRVVAKRVNSFWNSLTFIAEPFKPSDIVFIEIYKKSQNYAGALGVGVTTVNPENINCNELPDNADLLAKRPGEFWKFSRDIETAQGDQLALEICDTGDVSYSMNGSTNTHLLSSDMDPTDSNVWLAFDIYGSVISLRIMGIIRGIDAGDKITMNKYSINDYLDSENDIECFMCYKKDRIRNCVIQPCGHRSFCQWCSITCMDKQQLKFIVCPVCGGPIQGVIKINSGFKIKESLAISYVESDTQ